MPTLPMHDAMLNNITCTERNQDHWLQFIMANDSHAEKTLGVTTPHCLFGKARMVTAEASAPLPFHVHS
jgi:hypothetical protein